MLHVVVRDDKVNNRNMPFERRIKEMRKVADWLQREGYEPS
ncbi:hypothetical protein ACU8KH_02032 [Lachancea thermotolerans]